MSGIFVDENDLVNVSVNYAIGNDGKIVISDLDTQVLPGEQTLTVSFKRPDFETSQRLLQSSIYTDSNGEQNVNFMQMQNSLLYALAKDWDAKDKDGKKIPVSNEAISKLRLEIAKALIFRLIQKMGAII